MLAFLSSFFRDREFWQKVRNVILPLSFQQFLFHMGGVTDSLMLASCGQKELASVALASQYQFVFGMFLASCDYGLSIFVAQYWGKRDTETIAKLLGMSFQINLAIALLFFPGAFFFPKMVMALLTNVPELEATGSIYLRWVCISYFCMAVTQGMMTVCTCTGYAKRTFRITVASVVMDVIFNVLFIFGLGLGVKGAAIATVLVRFVTVLLVWFEMKREGNVRFCFRMLLTFPFSLFKYVVKYMLPIFGNMFMYGFGLTMGAVIFGHLGSDAVAANSLASSVKQIFSCFFLGACAGASVIVGNELGAGNLERGKDLGNKLVCFAVLSGVTASIFMPVTLPFIFYFSKLSSGAFNLLIWMMLLNMPYMFFASTNMLVFKLMNTGGDCQFTFWCDIIVIGLIVVPAGLLLAFYFHAPVLLVFFAVYSDEMIKSVPAFMRYRTYRWVRNLVRKT